MSKVNSIDEKGEFELKFVLWNFIEFLNRNLNYNTLVFDYFLWYPSILSV